MAQADEIQHVSSDRKLTVGMLLFPDVEVLDFAGPYEVFSVAARIAPRVLQREYIPFRVIAVAQKQAPVVARHGLRVVPDYDFATTPQLDFVGLGSEA